MFVRENGLHTRRSERASTKEWDQLSESSKDEVEQLVEILRSVKNGDFSVRLDYEQGGILARAGE
ncbi:MAG: hypothetical protein ACXVB9_16885, partial [Bdellovibrionota bacterium]